jgi:transposase
MPRQVALAPHLAVEELARRYRAAKEPRERSWWQILWLVAQGQSARQVAVSTGYSAYWIGQLVKRYNTEGPNGMRNRARTHSHRQEPLLSLPQQEELRQALAGSPPDAALWTARLVAVWMSERVGHPIAVQRGWDYLRRLRHSPQVPRPRHVQADPEAQAQFKKSSVRS